jgi:hypothetical protein
MKNNKPTENKQPTENIIKHKRFCLLEEPSPVEIIKTGCLMKLTGSDIVWTRKINDSNLKK